MPFRRRWVLSVSHSHSSAMSHISAHRAVLAICTLSAVLAGAPTRALAQTPATAAAPAAATPSANPADVASIDAILTALYDVISGPAGQKRNWDRMRSLFVPGARLIPTGRRADGVRSIQVWTVDQYIERVGPRLEESGFFERELAPDRAIRERRSCIQHVRQQAHGIGCATSRSRHQQHSALERRSALVGRDDLLGRGASGQSDSRAVHADRVAPAVIAGTYARAVGDEASRRRVRLVGPPTGRAAFPRALYPN